MNIGGALAEARSEAGLTITQVSERTRIRETIIRAIEHDDYSPCGGDYYARGHIRAIARAVGADPVPLIEEYDAALLPPPEPEILLGGADGSNGSDVTPVPPDTPWQAARRWVKQAGQPDARPVYSPPGITAAEAFRPGLPIEFERRRPRGVRLLVMLVVALIGVVIYLLVSSGSAPSRTPAAPHQHHSAAAVAHRAASPTRTATPPAAPPAAPLAIANAAAFGPAGTSQGDNPQDVSLAIDGNAATSWHSSWYATPQLGGLQSGTGLLLSLRTAATITSATIVLGSMPGGTVELRAGDTPTLADLPVVATSANPGGTLTVRPTAPVKARYALIWFIKLPPDGAGTYQARIYDIRLMGNPG